MSRIPRFWIACCAIIAIVGITFVLITPAPDELPSTGPHGVVKVFVLASVTVFLQPFQTRTAGDLDFSRLLFKHSMDLSSLTCSWIC